MRGIGKCKEIGYIEEDSQPTRIERERESLKGSDIVQKDVSGVALMVTW
jgi:hypothetical protein